MLAVPRPPTSIPLYLRLLSQSQKMHRTKLNLKFILRLSLIFPFLLAGCNLKSSSTSSNPSTSASNSNSGASSEVENNGIAEANDGAVKQKLSDALPQSNFIKGKVTMENGSPLRGDIKDIAIGISGVSTAAERVSYSPLVKADGTYSQKVAGGQYTFSSARIEVVFKDAIEFQFPLEPVGRNWNKNQDAAEGIVQDYVWKTTGATPYGKSSGLDKHNATHWYGMCVGLAWQKWRSDMNSSTTPPPDGTVLAITCSPTSMAIDGSSPSVTNLELTWDSSKVYPNDDIADLIPADYEITGVAKLPDGTSKPMLFQGSGDYPKFFKVLKTPLVKDNIIRGMAKHLCGFIIE